MRYAKLVDLYEQLDKTTKRLRKTYVLSQLIKSTPSSEMEHIMLLAQGKVYPSWDESKMGVASKLILKAINITTGIPAKEVEISWKKLGDLGEVAKELVSKKKQATLASHDLTVKKVFENIRKLSGTEGKGSVDRKMNYRLGI